MKKEGKSFKNIKFNNSLLIVFLAALIFLISFVIYSNYSIEMVEEYEENEEIPQGNDCIISSDCPQPRCYGMKSVCKNGYCVIEQTISTVSARCIDLKTPVCGNDICEADEKIKCPDDCK